MKHIGRLELSVFICGAALMIVEIVGSRIIAPYLGVSLYSWASIIAVILGSLSLGYWFGGKMADDNPSELFYSAVIILSGASLVFIQFLVPIAMYVGIPFGAKYGPLVASLILFFPASFLFGIISPFAIRLKAKAVKNVGEVAGSLYAFSTLGSISGTLLAGFVLIPSFGVKTTLLLTASAVILTGLFFLKNRLVSVLFTLLLLASFVAPDTSFTLEHEPVFQSESEYYHIAVSDVGSTRILMLDADSQSAIKLGTSDFLYSYVRTFVLSRAFVRNPDRILLVGMGGGTIGRYFLGATNASVDALEIDQAVVEVAKKYFGFQDIPGRTAIHVQDARLFLNGPEGDRSYDIIFVDAYSSRHSMPYHLTTVEAIRGMKSKLAPGGVVAVNVISAVEGERSEIFRSIHSTYAQVFQRVYVSPLEPEKPTQTQNIVFFATDESSEPDFQALGEFQREFFPDRPGPLLYNGSIQPGVILTDDYAPLESMVASMLDN